MKLSDEALAAVGLLSMSQEEVADLPKESEWNWEEVRMLSKLNDEGEVESKLVLVSSSNHRIFAVGSRFVFEPQGGNAVVVMVEEFSYIKKPLPEAIPDNSYSTPTEIACVVGGRFSILKVE